MNWHSKKARLFLVLTALFVCNALVAEFIGTKIFSVEATLGIKPFDISLFGVDHLAFNMTCGVLLWPVVFVMTDLINEYYGHKQVRWLSSLTAVLIAYAFMMVYASIQVEPAEFWKVSNDADKMNMQSAFSKVFGQGLWIICGSLVAFLIGQVLDAFVFKKIKQITGDRLIWVRATVSTLVSQFIDSFVVLYIAFVLGPQHWSIGLWLAVGIVNYLYKLTAAVGMIPLLLLVHKWIERYLGKELAEQMKAEAIQD